MAEEQKWQEPEGHRLCANNCGFFGSPTTLDLCSKCYKDRCLEQQRQSTAKIAVEKSLSLETESSSSAAASINHPVQKDEISNDYKTTLVDEVKVVEAKNRCVTCRKRVGLTGFRCRCGGTHCGAHRYPEEHACTFDFKAVGKEEIARANPLVVAEKLVKI